ncbi:hypothetical protein [Alteromonas sp. KUL49]|uniref:hypothetical protein n=1 Tax=Alteromonas sp. KUL49 TaxID=2480798 RepID=UPI00102F1249|nr:hypothetical protein [Alteromonas sp. KUL49]TAP41526.1 hypothetical protein EYS00_04930 [Alteromonas sp. KUL49]GEA10620.1 hypothetical protein KUL49_09950 [Alteromonas sp. KUL49]
MRIQHWLPLALAIHVSATSASDKTLTQQLEEKIEQAIIAVEQTPRQQWAYTVSRFENEEGDISQSVERYDPNHESENMWELVSINNNAPTNAQQNAFKAEKLEHSKNGGNSLLIDLRELINLNELEFIASNGEITEIGFPVQIAKLGDDANGKLQGTLRYNEELGFIEKIIVVNNADFSPIFSATISDLKMTFSFTKRQGAILPHQTTLDMKGRFAFFTKIDETSTDTYSGYQYYGEQH